MANSMAGILRNVIKAGNLPLSQMSERIETMYANGRIDAEERLELTELMHGSAKPENEAPDWKTLYTALAAKVSGMEARLTAAEKALGLTEEQPEDGGGEESSYPAWESWDGVNGGYEYGAKVSHNGKNWENMLEGMTNVWEPGAMGVDERYWKEIA